MDVVTYQCANCGSTLAFDIASNSWKCAFCGGEFTLDQLDGLEKTQEKMVEPTATYGEDAIAYNCPSCGGRIITDANTAATFCPYCHNPTVIASRIADEFIPDRLLPFKVTKQKAIEELMALCNRSPLTPDNFIQYAKKGEITGLYVPFFLYDCDVSSHLVGTGEKIERWSDSEYNYVKTDTYHVERSAAMVVSNLPVDSSIKMDDTLMKAIEPFDYSQMENFTMQYLSGYSADNFDLDTETALKQFVDRLEDQVGGVMKGLVTGYERTSTERINVQPQNIARHYVLLPVWFLSAKYNNEIYTFAMNGQTGKAVGKLPSDNGKLVKPCLTAFILIFLLIYIGGALL